ncbi:MAG: shikimate kinase [Eubacteriales bacterium]
MKKQIILVGFMGCGKSSVGRSLAGQIRYEYCDVDAVIEQQEKCTIADIFKAKGEAYFRSLEVACFQQLLEQEERTVIATGGGLPMAEENQKQLEQHPMVIYLKASSQTIYERVKRDRTRPLLQTEDPKGTIDSLLELRTPVYESVANLIVETDGKSVERVWREIQEALR